MSNPDMETSMMITDPTTIENVRRATIRRALGLKLRIDMWPNTFWQKNCLKFIKSQYGWTGRTVAQAAEFMKKLGDAK